MYAGRQKHSGQMHCDHFVGHILRYTGQTHTRTRNIQMKEREQMADHEMMNLDEMGSLRDSMELLLPLHDLQRTGLLRLSHGKAVLLK